MKFSDFFNQPQSGGKYVDNHAYIDKNRPGIRRVNGRMRDIYDQSDRATKVRAKSGYIDPMQWIWSGGISVVIFIIGLMIPKMPIINLIFRYSINFKSIFILLIISLIGGAINLGFYFITQTYDNAGYNESREMTSNDFNDAYIAEPTELPEKYDIAPDNKAHFAIDVTSILSHEMIKQVPGLKGVDGRVKIDNNFSNALFDTAGVVDKRARKIFNPRQLNYNPHNKHGKNPGKTVFDAINSTWHIPDCEDPDSQDPSGMYIVETGPENTIVLSETRGGKGQKYIEPILDVWSRQDHQPNIVTTDLKMELLVKGLKMFTLRGYNVRALNMLVDNKTDAINFLGYAVNAAVRNNLTRMETVVSNLSNIYFPEDSKGSSDPVWNQSASAVFKRTVYGLIEYYSEEIRKLNYDTSLNSEKLALETDKLWGRVTPYNAYNFIVALSSKMYERDFFDKIYNENNKDSQPDAEQKSGLTIYFDAVQGLPQNSLRTKINEQNKLLVSASGSEKMMASIYAITLASLIFFTDNKIINLTSARPSENLDLEGFSFPRRFAFKFNRDYARTHGLLGSMVRWRCYKDAAMKKGFTIEKDGHTQFDPDYEDLAHTVNELGWTDAYFKGKFPNEVTYIKVEFFDSDGYKPNDDANNLLLAEYDFIFKKTYRKNRSGRNYLINKITNKREVNGGTLTEYQYVDGKIITKPTTFDQKRKSLLLKEYGGTGGETDVKMKAIESMDNHYADGPTILYLVAPPHTTTYNSLLLTTISLVYNYQVENAYLGRPNQKPFYKTKYLFDEFGNMESKGKGIDDLDKKMTSGLGQDQQFTLILQSFSQLDSLYGADQSKTLIGNAQKYFYMKSKEKASIQQLIDMSGKKHVIQQSNVSGTTPMNGYHLSNIIPKNENGGVQIPQINKSYAREERPILNENDFLRLNDDATDGNAIVVTGNDPVVSMTSNIMPMSFQLLHNRTGGDGSDIMPQNLPVSSDTTDFNALGNLPNFDEMIVQRVREAKISNKVRERYKEVYGLNEAQMRAQNQDELSEEIMHGINVNLRYEAEHDAKNKAKNKQAKDFGEKLRSASRMAQEKLTDQEIKKGNQDAQVMDQKIAEMRQKILDKINNLESGKFEKEALGYTDTPKTTVNEYAVDATEKVTMDYQYKTAKRYAKGKLSLIDFYDNRAIRSHERAFAEAFDNSKNSFNNRTKYQLTNSKFLIKMRNGWQTGVEIHPEKQILTERYQITDTFYEYLSGFQSWTNSDDSGLIKWDAELARALDRELNQKENN